MMDKRILICDDDIDLIEMTSLVLSKDGWQINTLTSLHTFFNKLQEVEPSVILMDISMPDITGIEATLNLRKSAYHHIPVILFSANPKLASIAKDLNSDFIAKPFNITELRNKVNTYIKLPS